MKRAALPAQQLEPWNPVWPWSGDRAPQVSRAGQPSLTGSMSVFRRMEEEVRGVPRTAHMWLSFRERYVLEGSIFSCPFPSRCTQATGSVFAMCLALCVSSWRGDGVLALGELASSWRQMALPVHTHKGKEAEGFRAEWSRKHRLALPRLQAGRTFNSTPGRGTQTQLQRAATRRGATSVPPCLPCLS